jgi:transcriptional regulator with XRE-family HTH domain
MTQKELGIALGFDPGSADIRVSQYESDNRKAIKEPMLRQMAEIFKVSYNALKAYEFDNPIDVMESFFWFEEEFPLQIALFEFQTDKDIDKPILNIPAGINGEAIESPIAVMFALPEYRRCFKEWQQKKRDYHNGVITKEEYVEWKLQWDYKESSE